MDFQDHKILDVSIYIMSFIEEKVSEFQTK